MCSFSFLTMILPSASTNAPFCLPLDKAGYLVLHRVLSRLIRLFSACTVVSEVNEHCSVVSEVDIIMENIMESSAIFAGAV